VTTQDPHPDRNLLAERIHAALPQTQCTRCGYPDCAAYAQAIAAGSAAINQCPPGGAEGVQRLAAITGLPVQPLNPANGFESPRTVAIIDEAWCIGCTLCIKACPTDAILGSNKMMHTIIEPYCTGCELCVPVCPVDCISFENVTGERTGWQAWSSLQADTALERYKFHSTMRPQTLPQSTEMLNTLSPQADTATGDKKRDVIDAALARSRAARQHKT
jgi:Na+-translocating ferredoxin:NAD+ oxidoreductase subunit B